MEPSFFVTQLNPSLNSKDQIKNLCRYHSGELDASFITNKPAFLFALSGIESAYGEDNYPKYEPGYGPGGIYFQRSRALKHYYYECGYGALASCSWGPWQIMFIVAVENDYKGHPAELHNAMVSAPYVVNHLNHLIKGGADTIEKLVAAYNAGLGCLKNNALWPKKYVSEFLECFSASVKILD